MKNTLIFFSILFIGFANVNAQSWDTTLLLDINNGVYNDITFINNNHGFIIGDSNIFLETKDAGKTWHARSPLPGFSNPNRMRNKDLKQILFLNDTLGFMRNNYELFQTKDAGETWVDIINNNGGVKSFDVFNNKLTIYSDQAFGTLLMSVYSLEHDTFSYEASGFFPVYYLGKTIRLNDSILITTKDTGCIYRYNVKTKEVTKTYRPSDDGLSNLKIIDMFFLNKDTGFASINYIWLKKTVDGGKTWFTDTTFNSFTTTKVFSWANGELYLNSVNFPATNFVHKYNRNTFKWDYETKFVDNNLGFGYNNLAGIAGNGTGLFTVFEKDILGYKTKWNYIKSIPNIQDQGFKVYPNPSKGDLYIESQSPNANYLYKVRDLQGREIKRIKQNSNKTHIKLSPKGIFLLIIEENGTLIGYNKLIVE